MITLREAFSRVQPAGAVTGVRALAALLVTEKTISLRAVLHQAERYVSIIPTSLTFVAQNLALFPPSLITVHNPFNGKDYGIPDLYKGQERDIILDEIANQLRNKQWDVVGFSEFWVDEEKKYLRGKVGDVYPNWIEGPKEDAPEVIELEVFDGGLMILSRHPIVSWHQTIYRSTIGEDTFVNKGVLHARIAAPQGFEVDVFLSHTQSCPPEALSFIKVGPGDTCNDKLQVYQVSHLHDFIKAYSSPLRPALLMGDLNHNGVDTFSGEYGNLIGRLGAPLDVWGATGVGVLRITPTTESYLPLKDFPGITYDDANEFKEEKNIPRYENGKRLDYLISWPSIIDRTVVSPKYADTYVLNWLTASGKDLSDHYGLITRLMAVRELDINTSSAIASVQVILSSFHCLRETGAPTKVPSEILGFDIAGSDETKFELRCITQTGAIQKITTDIIENIDSGTSSAFPDQLQLTFGDPGDWLAVILTASEIDKGLGITTDTVALEPTEVLILTRSELCAYQGHSTISRTVPILRASSDVGGEYAVHIGITVE